MRFRRHADGDVEGDDRTGGDDARKDHRQGRDDEGGGNRDRDAGRSFGTKLLSLLRMERSLSIPRLRVIVMSHASGLPRSAL